MKRVTRTDIRKNTGMTVVEVLVSIAISSVVMITMVKEYANSLRIAKDEEIKSAATVRAQAVLESMGAELRVLGNGVPYDQPNFQIGENTLSDPTVTRPINIDLSNNTQLAFRLNETGDVHLLTADYQPALGPSFTLTSVEGLASGDEIYLSNSVVGEDDGLYGVISGVNTATNTVTLNAGYVYSPGATFNMGTICERVPLITYNSPADWSGITRDAGLGNVLFGQNSKFTVAYLDYNGNEIAPPLTELDLVNSLRKIRVTVEVQSDTQLRDGNFYTAAVSQTYSLRNLNYLF